MLAAVAAGCLAAASANELPNARQSEVGPTSSAATSRAEHRYRIGGKVRLALFWVGRDDVGTARLTWRTSEGQTDVAFLAGSEPERAPRRLNQWVYLREELRPEHGSAFVLRSVSSSDTAAAMPMPAGGGSLFGASCSVMRNEHVSTAGTTVTAPDATYRMLADVLDRIASASTWKRRDAPVPAGAKAGFLTALKRALDADAAAAPIEGNAATYVYNGTLFELRIRRRQMLGETRVGARLFTGLARIDFAVRNRDTGEVTKFAVTYDPAVGSLPVQILYQPSFWLRIELRLDDEADVPADPGADEIVLARIRAICGRSLTGTKTN